MRPAAILILLALLTAPAFPSTIIVPDHYPTIQTAIDAAVNGDTVVVRQGTYAENIGFKGKAITVKSLHGPLVTIIDGGNPAVPDHGSVVSFVNGEGRKSKLKGFTITNGTGTVPPGSNQSAGGGIYCEGAHPTLKRNIIACNRSDAGGGIFCIGDSNPSVTENVISDNTGGGITLYSSRTKPRPIIADNEFYGNTKDGNGGAIFCYIGNDTGRLYIERNLIRKNTAGRGGGICCMAGDNDAVFIRDNIITGNLARDWEGGGGMWITGSPKVTGNYIAANEADGMGGGAFIGLHDPGIRFANNRVVFNQARRGGGIAAYGWNWEIPLINNTVAYNRAEKGGGLYLRKASVVVTNTILWHNRATVRGNEIHVQGLTSSGDWSYLTIDHCDVEGGPVGVSVENGHKVHLYIGLDNIDSDPLFAEPLAADFHLSFGSPCIDTGDDDSLPYKFPTDFEGDPRVAGNAVDMGADEFYFHLYHTGTLQPGKTINIKIAGLLGMPVLLARGCGVHYVPTPTRYGDLWLQLSGAPTWNVGPIPADGILVLALTLPSITPPGEYPFQALVGPIGGPFTTLTNLLVLTVQ